MAPDNMDIGPEMMTASVNRGFQQLSSQLNSTLRSAMREMSQMVKTMNQGLGNQGQAVGKIAESYQKWEAAIEKVKKAEEGHLKITKQIADLEKNVSQYGKNTRGALREQQKSDLADLKNLRDKKKELLEVAAANKKVATEEASLLDVRKKFAKGMPSGAKGGRPAMTMKRGAGGVWSAAQDVAGDIGVPGAGAVGTIGKYIGKFAGAGAAAEGGMGLMGGLSAGVLGGLAGVGVLGAGYTAMQGYKAYDLAHSMAPSARTALGQGSRNWRESLTAYGGYGGAENLQTLTALNRSMGAGKGMGAMRGVTDISNMFGIGREEAGAQAGALGFAGGAPKGENPAETLKKVMLEGVKGGMDRARITEYTQQVVGIQQRIFALTGRNVTAGVSTDLGRLMKGSGGEQFLHGPGMEALGGLNNMVQQAGHLKLQGPMMGVMLRAFGGKKGGIGGLYDFMKNTEGGLFGMNGGNFAAPLQKLFKETRRAAGGRKDIANMMMGDATGLGMTQIESLQGALGRMKGGKFAKGDEKLIEDLKKSTEDPMKQLLDVQSKTNESLAMLATGDSPLKTIVGIDTAIQKATEGSAKFLEEIAGIIAPGGAKTRTEAAKEVGGRAISSGALATMLPGPVSLLLAAIQKWSSSADKHADSMDDHGDAMQSQKYNRMYHGGGRGAGD